MLVTALVGSSVTGAPSAGAYECIPYTITEMEDFIFNNRARAQIPTPPEPETCIPEGGSGVDCPTGFGNAFICISPPEIDQGGVKSAGISLCDNPVFPTKCVAAVARVTGGDIHGVLAVPGPDAKFDMEFQYAGAAAGNVFMSLTPDVPNTCISNPVHACTNPAFGGIAVATLTMGSGAQRDERYTPMKFPTVQASVAVVAAATSQGCFRELFAFASASNNIPSPIIAREDYWNAACSPIPAGYKSVQLSDLAESARDVFYPLIRQAALADVEAQLASLTNNPIGQQLRDEVISTLESAIDSTIIHYKVSPP